MLFLLLAVAVAKMQFIVDVAAAAVLVIFFNVRPFALYLRSDVSHWVHNRDIYL